MMVAVEGFRRHSSGGMFKCCFVSVTIPLTLQEVVHVLGDLC